MKAVPIILSLLFGCSTQNRALDFVVTRTSSSSYQKQPFIEPSFYAKWKETPVALYVASENVALYNATEQAIAEINQAIGFDLLVLKGFRNSDEREKEYSGPNRVNSVVEVPDKVYFQVAGRSRKSLAVTRLITVQDRLWEADILIRSSTVKGRHMRATILHELGHLVGLGHTKDPRSFMYPELRDSKRFVLGKDDSRVLFQRYADLHRLASRTHKNN